MNTSREELIADLARDLEPARRPGRFGVELLQWLAASWLFVVAAMLAFAPMRPGSAGQLLESPHFLLESLLGLVAGVFAIRGAFALGIPEPRSRIRRVGWLSALVLLWVGFYIAGLWLPALEPSMLGKREGCYLQVASLGLPPLLLGLWQLRRFAALNPVLAGAVVGIASGAIPGLLMQFGCMYVPEHILTHHIAPIGFVGLMGALLGPIVSKRL